MNCDTCFRKYYQGMTCDNEQCGLDIYKLSIPCADSDHWTFPEDEEVKARPGWRWFKLDKIWWDTRLDDFVKWHDKVTKKCSIAQRAGVSVERINEAQEQLLKDKGSTGWFVNKFLKRVQRFFYEGKLK